MANPGIGNHLRDYHFSEIAGNVRDAIKNIADSVGDGVKVVLGGDMLHPPRPEIVRRSAHPWLHPTKGWRQFARPRKTNRRRKLILQGRLMVFKG